ncbi:MAG TPA: OmpH family outer membrane protein [Chitinophagaceae bacterium]|nr:OmpH family outer membrane protein [Chitinophagaceae bacterium]
MRKTIYYVAACCLLLGAFTTTHAQQAKVGVFDIDLMVQAMPNYREVDSLVQIYERDSLAAEYEIYQSEYVRLDSTYKSDSALVAAGKKSKKALDYTAEQRQKMGMNIVYWRQLSQNKSNARRSELARPLYQQVAIAYKKILDKKKYFIVLKPQTYEMGFRIDNLFLSVARELKLQGLPQELLALGDDPDAVPAPAVTPPAGKPKPKAN